MPGDSAFSFVGLSQISQPTGPLTSAPISPDTRFITYLPLVALHRCAGRPARHFPTVSHDAPCHRRTRKPVPATNREGTMRLRDKVAVIIGAGQTAGETIGNGRATVLRFAQ